MKRNPCPPGGGPCDTPRIDRTAGQPASRSQEPVVGALLSLLALVAPAHAQDGCVPGRVEELAPGTPGTLGVPWLGTAGVPLEGRAFRLELSNGLPGAPGVLLCSRFDAAPAPFPPGAVPNPTRPFGVSPSGRVAWGTEVPFMLDGFGASGPLLPLPVVPDLCGRTVVAQALVLDAGAPGGVASSRALRIRFGGALPGPRFLGERMPIGEGVSAVALADLSGDGHPDLVTANQASNDVSVRLGLGDLAFGSEARFPVGEGPLGLSVADVDSDGVLDVVVVNAGTSDLSVLRGLGDGTFRRERRSATGRDPRQLVLADLNGDDRPDAVVVDHGVGSSDAHSSKQLSILLGKGDGTFRKEWSYTLSSLSPSLAVEDLNRDGALDIVVTSGLVRTVEYDEDLELYLVAYRFEFSVRLGLGDGTFGPPRNRVLGESEFETETYYPTEGLITALALGDVGGDGFPDLVVTSRGTLQLTLRILFGLGDGGFGPQVALDPYRSERWVALEDIDGDFVVDLVSQGGVRRGVGDGAFLPLKPFPVSGSLLPCLGDLGGDGILDLVVKTPGGDDVTAWQGRGDGTFLGPPWFPAEGRQPILEDLDADGMLDLVLWHWSPDPDVAEPLSARRGVGDGTFEEPEIMTIEGALGPVGLGRLSAGAFGAAVPTNFGVTVVTGTGGVEWRDSLSLPGPRASSAAIGDLDGDGVAEVAFSTYDRLAGIGDDHALLVVEGVWRSGWRPGAASLHSGDSPGAVASVDLDHDGVLDLVTANTFSDDVTVRLGLGSPTLPDGFAPGVSYPAANAPRGISLADLDRDGEVDVVVPCSAADAVAILFGVGDGTFEAPIQVATGDGPWAAEVGDMDGDGFPDLVTANDFSDDLGVHLGRGDGTFENPTLSPAGDRPRRIALGDVDLDGVPDAVVTHLSGSLVLLRGLGDGTFAPPEDLAAGGSVRDVILTDLDGDGRPDLATANGDDDSVSVLLADPKGGFAPAVLHAVEGEPVALVAADVNGDGKLDLATANRTSDDASVLLGETGGAFAPARSFPAGNRPGGLVLEDVDADGKLDLLVGNELSDDVSLLLGRGNGTFAVRRIYPTHVPTHHFWSATVARDLDGDGDRDLVVARGSRISVFLGTGDGRLGPAVGYPAGTEYLRSLVVADLNGDGIPDLTGVGLGAGAEIPTATVLLGSGDGTFDPPSTLPVPTGRHPAVADVDGDAVPDLIQGLSVFPGLGDGTFGERFDMRSSVGGPSAAGDIDQDGDTDLVLGSLHPPGANYRIDLYFNRLLR